jgi:16S rRNA (cytidine1402-2'-O)-methyltransferase
MLYLIPTPIGNLEDITLRALRMLRELPVLICEDTRTTKSLLTKLEIDYSDKQLVSLTSFTKAHILERYVEIIRESEVGMVSDAGTPGLSDPGNILIKLCHEHQLPYTVLP